MFGILLSKPRLHLMSPDDSLSNGGSDGTFNNGGNGNPAIVSGMLVGENKPTQEFDISVLQGLKPSDKYLGRNRVSDIREAYQTYITGSPVGRGGQYAIDAARKYGTTLTEAARGYLVTVGLPTLANIIKPDSTLVDTTKPPDTTQKNPFQVLADVLPNLFGNAVYNPPLQSQAYGYTPTSTQQPLTQTGGSNIGLLIIVGIVGVIGYFLYKRFAK